MCLFFPIHGFLLIFIITNPYSAGSTQDKVYEFERLDNICGSTGSKVRLAIGDKVHVFSFNSSYSELKTLKCHLELSVPSSLFGFSVFIEEMSLAGSVRSGCHHEFVQFGRDILFVTTHLSQKYCGDIELPVSKEVNGVTKFEFPGSPLDTRIYTEDSDREMDIWIHINSPDVAQEDKTLTLVVTPFKKTCRRKDSHYQKCGYRSSCVRKELFCDGRVNCAWPDKEPRDEYRCKKPQPQIEETWLLFDLSLVILGIAACLLLFLIFGFLYCRRKGTAAHHHHHTSVLPSQRQLPPINSELLPSCPPPLLPPPYTVENPSQYIEQDANKPPTCDLIWEDNE